MLLVYDPTIGQWLSEDPLGLDPDINSRRYVGNSPLDRVDPTGLEGTSLNTLPDRLEGIARTQAAREEARRIGQAIVNTYRFNGVLTVQAVLDALPIFSYFATEERNKGYYCYEWVAAWKNAFNHESSSKYFKVKAESASTEDGRIHQWLRIESIETGEVLYVDDGFMHPGDYVHDTMPNGTYTYDGLVYRQGSRRDDREEIIVPPFLDHQGFRNGEYDPNCDITLGGVSPG